VSNWFESAWWQMVVMEQLILEVVEVVVTGNSDNSGNAGTGGSGVVILRWSTADATIGATRTGLVDGGVQTDGTDSYIVFTGGTGTVSFS
jgi:hypothetical protein